MSIGAAARHTALGMLVLAAALAPVACGALLGIDSGKPLDDASTGGDTGPGSPDTSVVDSGAPGEAGGNDAATVSDAVVLDELPPPCDGGGYCLTHCGGKDSCGQGCSYNCSSSPGWSCNAGGTCTCTHDPSFCTGTCGMITDNCGVAFDCGACDGGQCMPAADPCGAQQCGSVLNSCGTRVNCGSNGACASGGVCSDAGTCCTPYPNPCTQGANYCIQAPNGCGGTVSCSATCPSGQSCGSNDQCSCPPLAACTPSQCGMIVSNGCSSALCPPCPADAGACTTGTACNTMNPCCSAAPYCATSLTNGVTATAGACQTTACSALAGPCVADTDCCFPRTCSNGIMAVVPPGPFAMGVPEAGLGGTCQ